MKNHAESNVVKKAMQEQDKAGKVHANVEEANKALDVSSLDQVVGGFATETTRHKNTNHHHLNLPLGNRPNE